MGGGEEGRRRGVRRGKKLDSRIAHRVSFVIVRFSRGSLGRDGTGRDGTGRGGTGRDGLCVLCIVYVLPLHLESGSVPATLFWVGARLRPARVGSVGFAEGAQ